VPASIVRIPTFVYARAKSYLLTQAQPTAVLSAVMGGRNVELWAGGIIKVQNANTVVTATLAWTDPDTGADSYTWLNAQNLAPGLYNLDVLVIEAQLGSQVTLTVTPGTANNVLFTGSMRGEMP
jgi:hypothetical protein